MIDTQDLLHPLQLRFDYHSARVVLSEALERAGLEARQPYSTDAVESLSAVLAAAHTGMDPVLSSLSALIQTARAAHLERPRAPRARRTPPPRAAAKPGNRKAAKRKPRTRKTRKPRKSTSRTGQPKA